MMEGQRLAGALIGDPVAANMMTLGAAWQKGLVPLNRSAIMRAIELNGIAVEQNKRAFEWGRRVAHDPAAVDAIVAGPGARSETPAPLTLDALIERRARFLTDYRDAAYANRYRALVERVRAAEQRLGSGEALTRAVAQSYHKLLAVKDEWEVARLFAAPEFQAALKREFEGDYRLKFHIGAWPFGRPDPATGIMGKGEVGPWMMTALRWLARLRFLRGTILDPFRNSEERKLEQRLVAEFESDVETILAGLDPATLPIAIRLAALPETIKGYGHVKEAAAKEAAKTRARLLAQFAGAPIAAAQAA
jgi:indolepyruvate ferredoxin oxidoreductase